MTSNEITPWDILTTQDKYPEREKSNECTTEVRIKAADTAERVSRLLMHLDWEPILSSGFRTSEANRMAKGATNSPHMRGEAVDISDPDNKLDALITDELLERFNLYREHPSKTDRWTHLQICAPKSGKRSFYP